MQDAEVHKVHMNAWVHPAPVRHVGVVRLNNPLVEVELQTIMIVVGIRELMYGIQALPPGIEFLDRLTTLPIVNDEMQYVHVITVLTV